MKDACGKSGAAASDITSAVFVQRACRWLCCGVGEEVRRDAGSVAMCEALLRWLHELYQEQAPTVRA